MAQALRSSAAIVATDLSTDMPATPRLRPTWARSSGDAQALPFAAGRVDVVVCPFAAMRFADRVNSYPEARHVLALGGGLLCGVWDRLAANEFGAAVTAMVKAPFGAEPPDFLERLPRGDHKVSAILWDLGHAKLAHAPGHQHCGGARPRGVRPPGSARQVHRSPRRS